MMAIQLNNSIRFRKRMTQCQIAHMTGTFGSEKEKGWHEEQSSDEENGADVDDWAAILIGRSGSVVRPAMPDGGHCIHTASHGDIMGNFLRSVLCGVE